MENKINWNHIRRIAEENARHMGAGEEIEVYFVFNGVEVHNPFASECGRFDVDPVEYYGEAFLNSAFIQPTP